MNNDFYYIKSSFCVFALLLCFLDSKAIKLSEAILQKKVTIDAKWTVKTNGEPLTLKLTNLSNLAVEVEVPAGSHFRCLDDKAQDMLAMKSYVFKLSAKNAIEKTLRVHCMEKHDYGPMLNSAFEYMGNAKEELVTVANFTASTDKYFGISQSLVWALAEKQTSFGYYKGDSIAYWPLLNAVSSYINLGKYIDVSYELEPVPRIMYSSRVNISTYIAPNTKYTLRGYDKDGKILKEYFANKPIEAGFYNVIIGYNEIVKDSSFSMSYKHTNDKGTILSEKKAPNNLMEPEEKVFWLQTAWEMNIEQTITKANLKLYGPDNKLLLTLYENRNIAPAIRKTPYGFYHTYGKHSKFKVRLCDEKGNLVKEVELDGSKSEEKKVVRQKAN